MPLHLITPSSFTEPTVGNEVDLGGGYKIVNPAAGTPAIAAPDFTGKGAILSAFATLVGGAAPASLSYEILAHDTDYDFANGDTLTVDLTGYVAGDKVLIVYGSANTDPTAATVGGVDAGTAIYSYNGGTGDRKQVGWEFTLTGNGASGTIVVTNAGTLNQGLIAIGIKGGTRTALTNQSIDNSASAVSASITPTTSTNIILAVLIGEQPGASVSWTNATEVLDAAGGTGQRLISVAVAEDAPASSYSISAQLAAAERAAFTLLCYEPA